MFWVKTTLKQQNLILRLQKNTLYTSFAKKYLFNVEFSRKIIHFIGKIEVRTDSDGLKLAVSGFGLFGLLNVCRARVGPGFTKMSSDGPCFRAFKSPT